MNDIGKCKMTIRVIKTICLNVIKTSIYHAEELFVRSKLNACDMWAEITLTDCTSTVIKDFRCNASNRAILIDIKNSHLTIVITSSN